MTCSCVRCGKPIRYDVVRHMRRCGDVEYHFHAYDCANTISGRLPDEGRLFEQGAVICHCGNPIMTEGAIGMPKDDTYSCPNCKTQYHTDSVLESRRPGRVTIAPALNPMPMPTPTRIHPSAYENLRNF